LQILPLLIETRSVYAVSFGVRLHQCKTQISEINSIVFTIYKFKVLIHSISGQRGTFK